MELGSAWHVDRHALSYTTTRCCRSALGQWRGASSLELAAAATSKFIDEINGRHCEKCALENFPATEGALARGFRD